MIEFDGVEKRFGDCVALSEVGFTVEPGSITGLIGPNGSGKTTALRLVLALYYPDRGRVRVLGQPPSGAVSDRIGYLPEERGLYRRMTVRGVLRYYARLKSHEPDRAEVDRWLERLGITAWASERVEALSKGTAQKVQFIATVLHAPELLILDEPFSGLDPVSSDTLREVILEVNRAGTTVVLSTHDMAVAERMCDRIVMLHEGRKVLDETRAGIETRFGDATLKVTTPEPLPELTGVARQVDFGAYRELLLADGADPQAVLRQIVACCTVERFEISRPSLHDIFVRLANE